MSLAPEMMKFFQRKGAKGAKVLVFMGRMRIRFLVI